MSSVQALSEKLGKENTPEGITAGSGSNFTLSFLFLPKAQRQGITNFYALSRVIDNAVDDHGKEEGKKLLDFWRREVALCYDGNPTHPVTQAMQTTIKEFSITQNYLELLLEGCEMDLTKSRYLYFEELYQYCYRVAGVIGLVCMRIFGQIGEESDRVAVDLGLALQLTNILRDVKSDGERGRLYLPREELHRFGLSESDLLSGCFHPGFTPLLQFQAQRAQQYFDQAFARMRKLPRKPLIAAWIMGQVYQCLLEEIRKKRWDVFTKKITVPKAMKLWIALREKMKSLS